MKRQKIITQAAIVLAIIVFINLVAGKLYFRLDFTADKRYTLSEATEDVLEGLEDVISIKVYFSEDIPPQLKVIRQDFEEQLIEYENLAGGNIVYEFIDPNESPQQEQEAQQEGISPLTIQVTEQDQVKQQRAYMGAVLTLGDKRELIPMIQTGTGMEYSLTTSIKKLSVNNKPTIGLLQGHGEPPVNAFPQLMQQLMILYNVEPYTLTDTAAIPRHYTALMMIDPKDTIPSSQLSRLDDYLAASGNLFVAYSNLGGDLNQGMLTSNPDIGLKGWLRSKGIVIGEEFIIDANCLPIGVQEQNGPFMMTRQVQFPYFPVASTFGEHPVSQGIESMILPLVSTVTYQGDTTFKATGLAFSSENTGLRPAPAYFDINYQWTATDFTLGSQPLAMAIEGTIGNNPGAKIVVAGNGNFITNGEGQQQQQVNPDNINFAANAIDWLADDTGLVELRTRAVTSRPLDAVEDSTRNMLKYGNVFIPILAILLYGFIRRQQYLRKKQQWLQGNF